MKKLFFFLLTVVCALLYAPPASAWSIYLDPANTDGFTPTAYVWDSNNNNQKLNGDFPGDQMTKDQSTGLWKASGTSGTPTNVIFTKGDNGNNSTKLFDGDPTCSDGDIFTWNGTAGTTATKKAVTYTIYLDRTNITSGGLSSTNQVYFHTWDGSNYDPACSWDNPLECQKVNENIWKVTFSCNGSPKGFFLSSKKNENYTDRTTEITPTNGYIYVANGENDNYRWKVDGSVYNPATVQSVELWKDGAVYATDADAPYEFNLTNLTGTGVYKLKVNYSDGVASKYFIREFPNEPLEWSSSNNTYTLVEGNETLSFRLNSTDSQKIISKAKMTVNFDGLKATNYTLTDVSTLSESAKAYLYDGSTRHEMEHRRDGKFVLAGFTADPAKTYTVIVSINDNGTIKETSYSVAGSPNTLIGGIRDAEAVSASNSGFKISGDLGEVNVSIRLEKGVMKKLSLGDINGFYTIYLQQRFSDWVPYARLSSTDSEGFWWVTMTPVKGMRGVYSVTFDPQLYNRVRFLRQDHFDGNTNHQTVRTTEVINNHIYSINDEVDPVEGRGLDHELLVMPVELASVSLVKVGDDGNIDTSVNVPLSLDDSGNWKTTLSSTLKGGKYLIRVVGTDPTGVEHATLYTIEDGNLSSAANNGTADKVISGETPTPFTLDFGTASNAILSLVMTNNGATPAEAYLTDPNSVISALYLICRDADEGLDLSNPDARFTTSDGGHTWLWRGKVASGKKYYIRGIAPNGDVHIHSIGKESEFELKAIDNGQVILYGYNPTWSTANWSEQSEWGGNEYSFTFASDPTEIKMVIETRDNQTKLGQMSYSYEKYTPRASAVYMPLSRNDFAAGPRYFFVGNRTADWRLQPEWELAVDETATSASGLKGRLMYKQYFGIAKVDTYDDYIMHNYTLYTAKDEVNDSKRTLTLYKKGDSLTGPARYEDETTYKHGDDYAFWNTSTGDWTSCSPALISDATVTLNASGEPVSVSFEFTTDKNEVAKNRSFTLVGADIRYEGVYSFNSGRQRDLATMTHVRGKNTVDGWQNAWIQANASGVPYVDGLGNVLYNTAFDATWMAAHSTPFYKQAKDFTYDSKSVTFIPVDQLDKLDEDEYADLYKFHPEKNGIGSNKIGNGQEITVGEITYTEDLIDYSDWNPNRYNTGITNSDWQCMVVKEMWLEGPFKVWAGWGGNLKCSDNVGDGTAENDARWFYENGGHGYKETKKDVEGYPVLEGNKNVNVYATCRDVNGADFNLKSLRYYPRVILWYNPSEGFNASAIQLVRPGVGPNIQAFYNTAGKKNTLRYRWWVSVKEGTDYDDQKVTGYVIDRYRTGDDNNEVLDRANIETVTFSTARLVKDLKILDSEIENNTVNLESDPRVFHFTDDSEMLAAGSKYRYRIRLTVEGVEKKAASNELPIYTLEAPVIVTVKQQMFDADGTQNDNGSIYSFNLQLNADLAAKHADKVINPTAAATDQKTVAQALRNYVVTVDDHVYNRLAKATSLTIDGMAQTSVDLFSTSTGSDVLIGSDGSSNTYLPAGTHYFIHTVPTGAVGTALNLPTYVWHNVTPNFDGFHNKLNNEAGTAVGGEAYRFYVYLVSEEDFIKEWATMNFSDAPGSADMIAPPTALIVDTPVLRKAQGVTMSNTPIDMQVSGTRLVDYATGGDGSHAHLLANPVHYTRLNEVAADATFDALPVTREVIDNHSIGYTVYVTKTGTTLADAMNDKKGPRSIEVPAANKPTQAEISNFDLDDVTLVEENDLDGHGTRYIDAAAGGSFDTHLRVSYLRNGDDESARLYNDHDAADKGIELNFNVDEPTVNPKEDANGKLVKARRYESQYYHNGGKNHLNPDHGPDTPCDCGECTDDTKPHTESLGWFAHGVIDLGISGIDNDNRNAYIGFHLQQEAANDKNGECYSLPGDTKMYRHSFTGTRAANGGAPLHKDWGAEWGTALEGYTEWVKDSEWTDANDWSTKAVEQGHLPLHINPLCAVAGENGALNGTLSGYVNVIYPVVKTQGVTLRLKTAAQAATAPSRADADAPAEVSDLYLVGAKTPVSVDLSRADIVTGVEDVAADNHDGPAEYYNLQGIRITNPAKGNVYIVRQGRKVSKLLYK